MERRRWGGLVASILVILILGGAALLGYWAYDKAKTPTMPALAYDSVESYAANIGNALINDRELEIPPEILSTLIREKSGRDVVCAVTPDDKLKVWFRQDIQVLGETDVALTLGVESYDQSTGELTLKIRDIYLGDLKIPDFLRDRAMSFAKGFASDKVSVSGDRVRLVIDRLQTEMFGMQLEAGVTSVSLKEGKLYFGLYANMDLDLGSLLGGLTE